MVGNDEWDAPFRLEREGRREGRVKSLKVRYIVKPFMAGKTDFESSCYDKVRLILRSFRTKEINVFCSRL